LRVLGSVEALYLYARSPFPFLTADRGGTILLIAGCLGLGVSEIVALRWRDFD